MKTFLSTDGLKYGPANACKW